MKKNYLLLSIVSVLLLLGIGCGSSDSNNENKSPTNTPEAPIVDVTLQQQAYLFCTQKGFEIQIRYESALNRNIAYCVFNDEEECESVAFMQGKCPVKELTEEDKIIQMFEPVPGDDYPLRLCDPVAQPVCGVDNKTYTNGCIAEFLGVNIAKHQACDRTEDTNPSLVNDSKVVDISATPSRTTSNNNSGSNSGSSTSNPPRTPTPGTTESANTNAWVEIPLSLLQSTAGKENRIDRCVQGNVVTFYVHDDFPTLYNAKGEVICYPGHDINNTCPSYITSGAYASSCTRVTR